MRGSNESRILKPKFAGMHAGLLVLISTTEDSMRRVTAAFLVLLTCGLGIVAQNNGEWIKYTSVEGRYGVSLPQAPTLSTQETTSPYGGKVLRHTALSPDGTGTFMIGYYDYEPSFTFSFDDARDAILRARQATLLGETAVRLGRWRGRQLRFLTKMPDGLEITVRARMYDVAHRVYTVQCIFPKAEDGLVVEKKCLKVIDSFKVQPR